MSTVTRSICSSDAHSAACLDLIERRAELLRLLCIELGESQKCIAALDLGSLQHRIQRQESLCIQLRFIARELESIGPNASTLRSEFRKRWAASLIAVAEATSELDRVKRVQSVLLRKSRRSVNVLMNVFSTFCLDGRRWDNAPGQAAARGA